ncbi:MAG: 1-deoxy-D-xylulose-5-phosphate synthase [Oscillospiraceae bacterium]|nr:1-deoxy-D-xylulose-5-phosphate synthase [Candidatus Ruminococcus equi]
MDYSILEKIKSPSDVKSLSESDTKELCKEIRAKLIEVVSVNGGHLSSNLGTVELTVAIHKAFDSPKDSIVFDVGHQCYTHKMLTGRYQKIDTIRTCDGLSGFPKRSESEHDAFNAGHASTSISAAYGIAKAKQLVGDNSYTIAVIGDGSLTGGLAYEGLNNAGRFNKNFIVILNDNKMSISKNVGAMARYLTSIRVNPWYIRLKSKVERVLVRVPLIGKPIRNGLRHSKSKVKRLVLKDTIFDRMGFSYYGPVDGHDLEELANAMFAAKRSKDPCLIHVVTTKGKGYHFAEDNSAEFHGIGSFNINTGEPISKKENFSSKFSECLCDLAEKDEKICAITAAMRTGTGLVEFSHRFKNRFFDVGIAEEHAVTFAGGLATKGLIPVFAVYSTFLQRSYDQLIHDVAMQKLHIVLAIDRAGVVGEDGETHQGLFDVSMLNSIPNTTIFSPCYFDGLSKSLSIAVHGCNDVVAVRYPRGGELYRPDDYLESSANFDIYGDENARVLIVTYGRLFSHASLAYKKLKEKSISICILKLCKIKPIDVKAVSFATKFSKIYFYEEGIQKGGIAETFREMLYSQGFTGEYDITAVDDKFVSHDTVNGSLEKLSLDCDSMVQRIEKDYEEKT